MSTVWNLSRLRYTIRKLTGQFDAAQLPDSSNSNLPISDSNPSGIDDYINDFYLYDLDETLRSLHLKTYYTFSTIPNVATYNLPINYFTAEPPIYVDGIQIAWYQNPDIYYRVWPELDTINQAIATGNGGRPYSFTLTATPIKQGTVTIGTTPVQSPAVEVFTDADTPGAFVNPGVLMGSLGGTGTINYLTGLVNINYANPLPNGVAINVHYYPYVASRPRDILFFNQQFNLKPIPNDVYQMKMVAYITPTVSLANGTTGTQFGNFGSGGTTQDLPQINEWWQMIAYGAAMKILIELGDHAEYERVNIYFERAKNYAQRKALRQLSNQRIQTPYTENATGPAFPIYPFY